MVLLQAVRLSAQPDPRPGHPARDRRSATCPHQLQFQGKTPPITRYLVQTYLVVSVIYIVINLMLTRVALSLDARMKARAAAG